MKWFKKWLEKLFCFHYWVEGWRDFSWKPNPWFYGPVLGEGVYEIYPPDFA